MQSGKFDITSTDIYRDILHTQMKFLLNMCSKYFPQREPSKVSRALESVQTREPGAKAEGASKTDRGQSTMLSTQKKHTGLFGNFSQFQKLFFLP